MVAWKDKVHASKPVGGDLKVLGGGFKRTRWRVQIASF